MEISISTADRFLETYRLPRFHHIKTGAKRHVTHDIERVKVEPLTRIDSLPGMFVQLGNQLIGV